MFSADKVTTGTYNVQSVISNCASVGDLIAAIEGLGCGSGAFLKVGLSPSKKNCVICLIENPLKMMKNAFYFILKALFVLRIFKFLSQLFGHVRKTA